MSLYDSNAFKFGVSLAGNKINALENKAISKVQNKVSKAVGKIISKNQKGINKILKFFNMDKDGAYNVYDKLVNRPDPLFDFEFQVKMPAISSAWSSADALDPLWIEDADIPFEVYESDQFVVNCHSVKTIMNSSNGDLTVSIYGDYQTQYQKYLDAWYASIRSPNGRYNLPYGPNNSGYKKMIEITIRKGAMDVLSIFLSGCMPTGRDGFKLSSDGGNRHIASQTFSVDKVYIKRIASEDPLNPEKGDNTFGGRLGKGISKGIANQVSTKLRGF